MGYSHYYYVPERIEDFGGFLQDVQAIVTAASGLRAETLVDERSGGRRVVVSGGGETLAISEVFEGRRRPGENLHFDSVKTVHASYDTLVIAILVALKDRDPRVRVSSDGGEAELDPGIALFARATGRTADYSTLVKPPGE